MSTDNIIGDIIEGDGIGPTDEWILANNVWNDLGVWIDTEFWND